MNLIKDMNGDIFNLEFVKSIIFSEEDITINFQDGDSESYEIDKHAETNERIRFAEFKKNLQALI